MRYLVVCVLLAGCTHYTPKPYNIDVTYRECSDAGVCKVVTETLIEEK